MFKHIKEILSKQKKELENICKHDYNESDIHDKNIHYWYHEKYSNYTNCIYDGSYLYLECTKCKNVKYKRVKFNFAPFEACYGGIHKVSTVYDYRR